MNTRTLAFLVAAAVLLLVSACGGGGGDGDLPMTDGEPPEPPQLREFMLIGDPLWRGDNNTLRRGSSSCIGAECTIEVRGTTIRAEISDFDPRPDPDARFRDGQERNGFTIAEVEKFAIYTPGSNFRTLGAWGDYAIALAGRVHLELEQGYRRAVMPISLGEGTGTNPVSGSATWSGVMVGSAIGPYEHDVTADATLQVDFSDATLDLAFSDISSHGTFAATHGDIAWHNVPIAGGVFTGEGLEGRFYGPKHEEAGGVFERDQLAGAFVVQRQ